MKKVWTISYRQGRGRIYACDLKANWKCIATVAVDVPMHSSTLAVVPPAFAAMVGLQPEVSRG